MTRRERDRKLIGGFSCWCHTEYGRTLGCALHTPLEDLLPIIGVTKRELERQAREERKGRKK